VVVSGQFLIDSESNIESALARMQDDSAAVADKSEDADSMEEPMDHRQNEKRTE